MKRQRGRGRKPSNPSNRSYESNGPDVKIRGNASQVYDKYLQYARDAQTSGDRIAAEAYYQHAEHYYRIMAANMPKERPQNQQNDEADADGQENTQAENGQDQSETDDAPVDNLQVVDGAGEQPEDIAANGSGDNQGEEKPRRRQRRPRRRPTNDAGQEQDAQQAASAPTPAPEGDDAGLRAMMSRTAAPEIVEAPSAPEPVQEAES